MTTVTTVSDTCNTNTRLGFLSVLTGHIVLMKGYRAGKVLAVVVSEPLVGRPTRLSLLFIFGFLLFPNTDKREI